MVDYTRLREVSDRQIRSFCTRTSMLRRADAEDRECWAYEVQLTAVEKQALKNFKSRIFIISAVGLTIPPAREDSLIVFDEAGVEQPPLRQVAPVAPMAPGGLVVYWEIQVE
jgi:hypothetical protein